MDEPVNEFMKESMNEIKINKDGTRVYDDQEERDPGFVINEELGDNELSESEGIVMVYVPESLNDIPKTVTLSKENIIQQVKEYLGDGGVRESTVSNSLKVPYRIFFNESKFKDKRVRVTKRIKEVDYRGPLLLTKKKGGKLVTLTDSELRALRKLGWY